MNNRKWGIRAQGSNKILLASSNLQVLKFTQLLVSRYWSLEVESLEKIYRPADTDLEKKLQWVYSIVDQELEHVNTYIEKKKVTNIQADYLTITKEFLDIVGCTDPTIEDFYKTELDYFNSYIQSCNQHKTFVFNKLLTADYSKTVEEINQWFFSELEQYPIDYTTVAYHLNAELLKGNQ
jgi:hypothetical protein